MTKQQKRIEQELLEFWSLQPDAKGTARQIATTWLADSPMEDVQAALDHLYVCHVLSRYGAGDNRIYFAGNIMIIRTIAEYLRDWEQE